MLLRRGICVHNGRRNMLFRRTRRLDVAKWLLIGMDVRRTMAVLVRTRGARNVTMLLVETRGAGDSATMIFVVPDRRVCGRHAMVRTRARRPIWPAVIRGGLTAVIMETVDVIVKRTVAVMVLPILVDAKADDADADFRRDFWQKHTVALADEGNARARKPAAVSIGGHIAPCVPTNAAVDRQRFTASDVTDGGIIGRRACAQRTRLDCNAVGSHR